MQRLIAASDCVSLAQLCLAVPHAFSVQGSLQVLLSSQVSSLRSVSVGLLAGRGSFITPASSVASACICS